MKILFLTRLFYPHIGGVEKHVLEVSKQLIVKGHSVIVITEELPEKKLLRQDGIDSIKIYRIPVGKNNWFKKFRIWRQLWKYRKIIREADIVHCHDVFFWYFPFRLLHPFKKSYITFHGYETYFPPSKRAIFIRKVSEKLANGNICIGEYIKKWYGTKPTFVTYGGVNLIHNSESRIQNAKKQDSALFIGRLDRQTGILTYVEAIEILKKKMPKFDFCIIGDGKLRGKIDKKIKILRPLKNASEYFQKYNFVFVSGYLSILEAMAAKRLVFAAYDNPLKEDSLRITPFSKYIVIANSPSDLISKIFFYLDHLKEKEKLVKSAYGWVRDHSWEQIASTYLKLWKV